MIRLVSATDATPLARLRGWHRVNIQVLDNNTLFIGSSKQDILDVAGVNVGGHQVDKTHPYQDWVEGELWGIASVDNMAINILIWPGNFSTVG